MKRINIWLSATCFVCAALVWNYGGNFDGTEFSGGRTTRTLLHAFDLGLLLFFVALLLSFFYRRLAAVAAVLASLLCLPIYLFHRTGPISASFPRGIFGSGSFNLRLEHMGNLRNSVDSRSRGRIHQNFCGEAA